MPVFIFLGWVVGLLLGAIAAVSALLALGIAVAGALSPLRAILAPLIAALGGLAVAVVVVFVVLCFLVAYLIATASIAPLLPAGATFPWRRLSPRRCP